MAEVQLVRRDMAQKEVREEPREARLYSWGERRLKLYRNGFAHHKDWGEGCYSIECMRT